MDLLKWLRPPLLGGSGSNTLDRSRRGRHENQEEPEIFLDALGPRNAEQHQTRQQFQRKEDDWATKLRQEHLDRKSPRMCRGCMTELGHEEFVTCTGSDWHRCCFRCHVCYKQITPSKDEFIVRPGARVYHNRCRNVFKSQPKENRRGKCIVCSERFVSGTQIKFHPFWKQEFCPVHDEDGTTSCCSCERLEPRDNNYRILGDGRKLCFDCLNSAIMDASDFQKLYSEVRDFFKGCNMEVEQGFLLPLVKRCSHHDMMQNLGQCLSKEQSIRFVSSRPKHREGSKLEGPKIESQMLSDKCGVIAILMIYELPRLLAGSILVHMLMHAWFRLHVGYQRLSPEVEEGMCQVMAHMWLESKSHSASGGIGSSSFPSFSAPRKRGPESESSLTFSSAPPKEGPEFEFEKKVLELFKYQIESDASGYGDGFRKGMRAVKKYGLAPTLDCISKTGNFSTG